MSHLSRWFGCGLLLLAISLSGCAGSRSAGRTPSMAHSASAPQASYYENAAYGNAAYGSTRYASAPVGQPAKACFS